MQEKRAASDQRHNGNGSTAPLRSVLTVRVQLGNSKTATTSSCGEQGEKQVASFYFTNVLELIPYVELRKGFEVCGMLFDVYLSKRRNSRGEVFGLVRLCNVPDEAKLVIALNNVWY